LTFDSKGQDDPKRKEGWEITLHDIPRMLASAKKKYPQGAVRSQLRRSDKENVIQDEENLRLIFENETSLVGKGRNERLVNTAFVRWLYP
jgi:hypothetical protein